MNGNVQQFGSDYNRKPRNVQRKTGSSHIEFGSPIFHCVGKLNLHCSIDSDRPRKTRRQIDKIKLAANRQNKQNNRNGSESAIKVESKARKGYA